MVISPDEEAVTGLEDRPGVGPNLSGPSLAQLAAAPHSGPMQSEWPHSTLGQQFNKHTLSLSKLEDN